MAGTGEAGPTPGSAGHGLAIALPTLSLPISSLAFPTFPPTFTPAFPFAPLATLSPLSALPAGSRAPTPTAS